MTATDRAAEPLQPTTAEYLAAALEWIEGYKRPGVTDRASHYNMGLDDAVRAVAVARDLADGTTDHTGSPLVAQFIARRAGQLARARTEGGDR